MTAKERKLLQDLVDAYARLSDLFCKDPLKSGAYISAVQALKNEPVEVKK